MTNMVIFYIKTTKIYKNIVLHHSIDTNGSLNDSNSRYLGFFLHPLVGGVDFG